MSITAVGTEVVVRPVGEKVTVPDDPYAKLMYYLSCVQCVVDYDIPHRLFDYSKYLNLTSSEKDEVVAYCTILKPSIFEDNNVFIPVDNALIELGNQFYEISAVSVGIHVNESFVTAGQTVRTQKVMLYKYSWLVNNYYKPLDYIKGRNLVSKSTSYNYKSFCLDVKSIL